MNRYSKIKLINNTTKSRSIDFSDLQSFPLDITKPIKPQDINFKTQEPKQQTNPLKLNGSPPNLEENEEQVNTHEHKSFGAVKLIRNRSVSAAKQSNIALQTAVQRVFSMRRSSSVSERYCRIHDQCVTISSPSNDDEGEGEEEEIDHNNTMQTRSVKKKKKKGYTSGRILKACKRLLGI